MKNIVLFLACAIMLNANAQGDNQVLDAAEQEALVTNLQATDLNDSTKIWNFGGLTTLNFSQVSLNNWAGGGVSSLTATGLVNLNAAYVKDKTSWVSSLDLAYGLLKNKDVDAFKSDDRIEFNSKYGRKASDHWYYSALVNFRTQFSPGYSAPGDSIAISNFLAPAYVIGAIGMDYKPSENFSVFISPITSKTTIVNDPILSAAGAFGVEEGEIIRSEFGAYLKMAYQRNVVENVSFQTKLDLFSNYQNNPGNIDVSWETLISMKVNKFMTASVSTHLIYDDDIDIAIDNNSDGVIDEVGPRVQFKEVLAIGLSYKF